MLGTVAAADPIVSITSPSEGLIAAPGDKIGVDLDVRGEQASRFLAALGGTPVMAQDLAGAPPYHFVFEIPSNSRPGLQKLVVLAVVKGIGHPVTSNAVELDVERPDSPEQIKVSSARLILWIGAQQDLFITATYKDSANVDISKSTRLSFESESPEIASVSKDGKVTGVSPGSTRVLVNHEFPVSVVVLPLRLPKR